MHNDPMGSHKRSWTRAWKGPWDREGQEGVDEAAAWDLAVRKGLALFRLPRHQEENQS